MPYQIWDYETAAAEVSGEVARYVEHSVCFCLADVESGDFSNDIRIEGIYSTCVVHPFVVFRRVRKI